MDINLIISFFTLLVKILNRKEPKPEPKNSGNVDVTINVDININH